MLDQNTDRMWYVIGAVIVGASLIFLMNGIFPGLFGQVGTAFEGKVADAGVVVEDTTMTDGAGPVVPNPNLIPNSSTLEVIGYQSAVPGEFKDGWTRFALPTTLVEVYVNKAMPVEPETQYTQSMYIRSDADSFENPQFSFYWPVLGKGHRHIKTYVQKVSEGLWRVTGTARTLPGQTTMRVPDLIIRGFDGGTYVEFGQYKLETGSKVTPWVE